MRCGSRNWSTISPMTIPSPTGAALLGHNRGGRMPLGSGLGSPGSDSRAGKSGTSNGRHQSGLSAGRLRVDADAGQVAADEQALGMLVEKLGENDRVALVVYAGAGLAASDPVRPEEKILAALDRLQAGGSTNGGGHSARLRRGGAELRRGGNQPGHPLHRRRFQCWGHGTGAPEPADRGEGRSRRLPHRARLRHGQLQGRDDGEAGRPGQRQLRLHRHPARSPQGAGRADGRHAGDHRQGREDPGRVQPGQGQRLPADRL